VVVTGFQFSAHHFYKMLYFALALSCKWYPYSRYFPGVGKQIVFAAYDCEFLFRQESVAQVILKGLL